MCAELRQHNAYPDGWTVFVDDVPCLFLGYIKPMDECTLKGNTACVLIYKSFSYIILSQARDGWRGDSCWPQPCDPHPGPSSSHHCLQDTYAEQHRAGGEAIQRARAEVPRRRKLTIVRPSLKSGTSLVLPQPT